MRNILGALLLSSCVLLGQAVPFADDGALKMLHDNRMYPQAVESQGEVYVVWCGDKGLPWIRSYGLANRTFSQPWILLDGDYIFGDVGSDVFTDKADLGQVFFNRWRIAEQTERFSVRLFFYVNLPAFALAKFVVFASAWLVDEVNRTFPYGLSYSSYVLAFGILLSFLQWYWVGRFGETLLCKARP